MPWLPPITSSVGLCRSIFKRVRAVTEEARRKKDGLIGIPVTNASVNPARSTGPALIVGGWAIEQLWLFWLAPIVGAALAGVVYPALSRSEAADRRRAPRLAA